MAKRKIQTRKNKSKKRIVLIASSLVFLLLVFAVVYMCYFKTTVASGVSICGIDISGMTKAEAKAAISKKAVSLKTDTPVSVSFGDVVTEIDFSKISPEVNVEESVDSAFKIGKSGSVFTRISDIISSFLSGNDIEFTVKFDYNAIDTALEPIIASIPDAATPTEYTLSDDGITVIPGTEGNLPDYDALYRDLSAFIFGRHDGTVKIKTIKSSYNTLTAEAIYNRFHSKIKDATYMRDENGEIVVTPSSDGIDFDVKEAQKILDKAKGKSCVIPINLQKASVTDKELSERLFTDELSSYYSNYVVGNTGRNTNLELACSKLNGTQLMPGETFSYVGVIGQGTYEEGYVDAAVYADGEVTTGVAGGICQGSSTLYSAVLFADLEIVQRVNHSMPVGYVPRGMDATIATPYIDFQFKNSTGYPIKISATCSGGLLDIKLLGFNEHPEKEVEITNKLISTTPFKTEEEENPNLAEGEEIVKQNGSDGCVIETYKTIKINGAVQSTKLISTSRYDPISKIVEIPPKKEDEQNEEGDEDSEESETAESSESQASQSDVPEDASTEESTVSEVIVE